MPRNRPVYALSLLAVFIAILGFTGCAAQNPVNQSRLYQTSFVVQQDLYVFGNSKGDEPWYAVPYEESDRTKQRQIDGWRLDRQHQRSRSSHVYGVIEKGSEIRFDRLEFTSNPSYVAHEFVVDVISGSFAGDEMQLKGCVYLRNSDVLIEDGFNTALGNTWRAVDDKSFVDFDPYRIDATYLRPLAESSFD